VARAVDSLAVTVGEDTQAMRRRVLKLVNLPRLSDADDHDLREVRASWRRTVEELVHGCRARDPCGAPVPSGTRVFVAAGQQVTLLRRLLTSRVRVVGSLS
jgi:hypothetical protein